MRGYGQTVMQDMLLARPPVTSTSVAAVECSVCGKGLADGCSITAKRLARGTALFCDIHYELVGDRPRPAWDMT